MVCMKFESIYDHICKMTKRCPRCTTEGCSETATHGLEKKTPLTCKEHKQHGYKNGIVKLCIADRCISPVLYGPCGGKPTHCKQHKIAGHVNLVSKRCEDAT